MDDCVIPRISGITRHHLAICITSPWTSSYYQKGIHFQSRAPSALIPRSFLRAGATSQTAPPLLSRCPSAGGPRGRRPPVALGAPAPVGAPEPSVAALAISSRRTGVQRGSAARSVYLVHSVLFRVNGPCRPSRSLSRSFLRRPPK